MYIPTRALVIRSVAYKDADSILTVLSDKLGRATVTAHGASRKNSPFASAAQLFACSDMILYESRGRYSLNEAQPVEQFEGLRTDIKKMALASYFAEVLCDGEEEAEAGGEVLRLALNCLYALSKGGYNELAVKAGFELRYATLLGYMPRLDACACCGKPVEHGAGVPETGEIYCHSCAPTYGTELTRPSLAAARNIVSCELKKLLSFSCGDRELKNLSDYAEKYLRACLERRFKTLDFYYGLGDYI